MRQHKLGLIPFLLIINLLTLSASVYAGYNPLPDSIKRAPENWFNLDPWKDGIIGISTERAYSELLVDKESTEVVVAIIDSGIETDHEDLKSSIWTNPGEIPLNGIDDDQNGYIDDIHGWNFIGGPDSTFVEFDTWELTREYARLQKKYENQDSNLPSGKDTEEYKYFLTLKADYEKQLAENKGIYDNILNLKLKILNSEKILLNYFGMDSIPEDKLNSLETGIDSVDEAAEFMLKINTQGLKISKLDDGLKVFDATLNYKLNTGYDSRYIVGDDYNDLSVKNYGNPYVEGPDAFHGTHVAGIICADRHNNIGVKGIAGNVKIMVLRAVPSGDERDKDIANAVRYAVDNGARIINMSFGKDYSPQKKYVDEAFRYADAKGVLIVHAAGNDSKNSDVSPSFPVKKYIDGSGQCNTWIEVGALHWKDGVDMAGGFTNYGRKTVDIFAPGVEIYSTVPDQGYRNATGTSMAAPVVTGVAALVLSYYPELTAQELKKVLLKSSVSFKKQKVKQPGNPEEFISFARLSKTGGVVNVYSALKMAEKY